MTERRRESSDEDLARAASRGDLAAFQTLVGRHQRRIYSLALRLVRSPAEAEDMSQEAFLRIFRGLGSFRGESQFSTWMVRVALNTFHRHLKRLPKTGPLPEKELADGGAAPGMEALPPNPSHPDPETLVAEREEAAQVRKLVSSLPTHFRDAVTVFYLHERSLEEAAESLGISQGTLKSRLFRAREMLLSRWQRTLSPGASNRGKMEVTPPGHTAGGAGVADRSVAGGRNDEDASRAQVRTLQPRPNHARCAP